MPKSQPAETESLEEKIKRIRKKNEEIEKRRLEVEADKQTAAKLNALVQLSAPRDEWPLPRTPSPEAGRVRKPLSFYEKTKERIRGNAIGDSTNKANTPPPDPVYRFLADTARDPVPLNNSGGSCYYRARGQGVGGRGKSRKGRQDASPSDKESPVYEAWRAERKRIDDERIQRQRTAQGQWRREWDSQKSEEDWHSCNERSRGSKTTSSRTPRTMSTLEPDKEAGTRKSCSSSLLSEDLKVSNRKRNITSTICASSDTSLKSSEPVCGNRSVHIHENSIYMVFDNKSPTNKAAPRRSTAGSGRMGLPPAMRPPQPSSQPRPQRAPHPTSGRRSRGPARHRLRHRSGGHQSSGEGDDSYEDIDEHADEVCHVTTTELAVAKSSSKKNSKVSLVSRKRKDSSKDYCNDDDADNICHESDSTDKLASPFENKNTEVTLTDSGQREVEDHNDEVSHHESSTIENLIIKSSFGEKMESTFTNNGKNEDNNIDKVCLEVTIENAITKLPFEEKTEIALKNGEKVEVNVHDEVFCKADTAENAITETLSEEKNTEVTLTNSGKIEVNVHDKVCHEADSIDGAIPKTLLEEKNIKVTLTNSSKENDNADTLCHEVDTVENALPKILLEKNIEVILTNSEEIEVDVHDKVCREADTIKNATPKILLEEKNIEVTSTNSSKENDNADTLCKVHTIENALSKTLPENSDKVEVNVHDKVCCKTDPIDSAIPKILLEEKNIAVTLTNSSKENNNTDTICHEVHTFKNAIPKTLLEKNVEVTLTNSSKETDNADTLCQVDTIKNAISKTLSEEKNTQVTPINSENVEVDVHEKVCCETGIMDNAIPKTLSEENNAEVTNSAIKDDAYDKDCCEVDIIENAIPKTLSEEENTEVTLTNSRKENDKAATIENAIPKSLSEEENTEVTLTNSREENDRADTIENAIAKNLSQENLEVALTESFKEDYDNMGKVCHAGNITETAIVKSSKEKS